MANPRTKEESDQICLDVINQMKGLTGPSLSQICGNLDETTGEYIGTGTLMNIHGGLYLITAQHVAVKMFDEVKQNERKYPLGLCHSIGSGNKMFNVLNPWTAWASPLDVAATRIDTDALDGVDIPLTSSSQFASDTNELEDDLYFIHGFPGSRSRFTVFFERGVFSTSQPYGGWLCDSGWSKFDPKMHFAITFPATDIVNEQSEPTSLPNAHGMSGSLVWKTNRTKTGEEWTPGDAQIVGLAQRYDQDKQCLVVTRAEYVKELLVQLLRSEYAYFRWIERGHHHEDALDDWVAAESAIPNLLSMDRAPTSHSD